MYSFGSPQAALAQRNRFSEPVLHSGSALGPQGASSHPPTSSSSGGGIGGHYPSAQAAPSAFGALHDGVDFGTHSLTSLLRVGTLRRAFLPRLRGGGARARGRELLFAHSALVLAAFLALALCELLAPSFFDFPFFALAPLTPLYFWWLWPYLICVSGVTHLVRGERAYDKNSLWRAFRDVQLALLEELGHRLFYLFALYAFASLASLLLQTVGLYLAAALAAFSAIGALVVALAVQSGQTRVLRRYARGMPPKRLLLGLAAAAVLGCVGVVVAAYEEAAVEVVGELLVVPLTHYSTLGTVGDLLGGRVGRFAGETARAQPAYLRHFTFGNAPAQRMHPFFVYAMVLSNALYRDAHLVRGWGGIVHAWWMAWVFSACTFHYGLLSAIVLHVMWVALFHGVGILMNHFKIPKQKIPNPIIC